MDFEKIKKRISELEKEQKDGKKINDGLVLNELAKVMERGKMIRINDMITISLIKDNEVLSRFNKKSNTAEGFFIDKDGGLNGITKQEYVDYMFKTTNAKIPDKPYDHKVVILKRGLESALSEAMSAATIAMVFLWFITEESNNIRAKTFN